MSLHLALDIFRNCFVIDLSLYYMGFRYRNVIQEIDETTGLHVTILELGIVSFCYMREVML